MRSSFRRSGIPFIERTCPISFEGCSVEQMTLEVEIVECRGVKIKETLCRTWRLEPLHLSFSPSNRLMRILCSIVGSFISDMLDVQAKLPECSATGTQLVCNQARWRKLLLQKLTHELFCGFSVAA